MKKTSENWAAVADHLMGGISGDWARNDDNGREVVLGDMIGGRYELWEGREFCGCVRSIARAMKWLEG